MITTYWGNLSARKTGMIDNYEKNCHRYRCEKNISFSQNGNSFIKQVASLVMNFWMLIQTFASTTIKTFC